MWSHLLKKFNSFFVPCELKIKPCVHQKRKAIEAKMFSFILPPFVAKIKSIYPIVAKIKKEPIALGWKEC